MRKLLLACMAIAMYLSSAAQCSVKQIPLQIRANVSDLIVEGKVVSKNSFWNTAHNMIYTSNTIEVYKVFKGTISTTSVEILTMGGTVGYDRIVAEPSLSLHVGEVGVFTCETVKRYSVPLTKRTSLPQYEAYGSVQGFVKYDLVDQTAADPFQKYTDIEAQVYATVLSPDMPTYRVVAPFDIHGSDAANRIGGPQNSVQSIASFSPTTVTAGTGTTITITGTNFGATQGSGSVRFRNADDGGATVITPLASQYISWSSTQIVVEVPQNAGTGTIQVVQGQTFTSAQTLTIEYAHLNVDFDPGPGTIAYQTDHINDNGSGGYTWRMNTAFAADAPASASFLRAFDSWRCATNVNWTIGANTSINDAVSDGTNIICFDNTAPLSAGILGVCYSYWSGCASGPTIIWYVNELDIIFDEGSNISPLTWEYGTAMPSGSEYDFETVAVHELGHGHQLGHVISPGAIMHYAISNGSANRSLGVNDEAGGDFVQAKSIVGNVCGPGAMTNHVCAIAPVAAFTSDRTSVCLSHFAVNFTDQSTNTPTSWSWTFTGATPSSSTDQHPTDIYYNTPGTYAVSLTATNAAGSDMETINGYVTVYDVPLASMSAINHVNCLGGSDGSLSVSVSGGTPSYSYSWTPSGGTAATESGLPVGDYTCTVTDANGCTGSTAANLIEPTTALSATIGSNDVTCNGASDGSAQANPSGGTPIAGPGYTYLWSTGSTFLLVTDLSPGTYTCTVTDDNGCTVTPTVTITEPTAVTANAGSDATICNGDNANLSASALGGTGAFTYSWAPGGMTGANVTVSPSTTTVYSVTAMDENGCVDNDIAIVTVNTCSTIPAEALSFDGTNDYISGTNSMLPQGIAARSFTAWIKPSQVQSTQTIFSYGGASANESCTISITGGNLYYSSGSNDMSGTAASAISANVWTHVAVTVNNKAVKFYVNGALKFSGTLATSPATAGTDWTISSATAPFAGWMDEVTVWSTAITTQVAATMNTELAAQTGLIGLYHFNQGFAAASNPGVTTATDASTASGTGTLNNFTLTGSSSNWVAPGRAGKTGLQESFCGSTLASMNTQLFAYLVSNATNYQWEFTDLSNSAVYTYTRGNNQPNFYLYMIPQLTYGKTYSIRVRSFVGGAWGTFGSECQITTPAFPTTQLNSVCGTTIASRYTQMFCTAVPNAQNYEYEFTDVNTSAVFTKLRGNNQSNFYLYMVPQAAVNTTYDVRVRAIVGGTAGSYGSVCTITTPATYMRVAGDDFDLVMEGQTAPDKISLADAASTQFNVYPNPNTGIFNVEVPSAENAVFELYDGLGRLVLKEAFTSQTQSFDISKQERGIYYIRIVQNNVLQYSTRILKQD